MISQPGSPAPTSPAPVDHTMDEASSVSAVSSSSVTQHSQAIVDRLNEKIASLSERLVDDSLSVEEMTTLQAELDSRTKQLDMLSVVSERNQSIKRIKGDEISQRDPK
ncbi:hypothetical protein BDA99DRAFT_531723 [Phascolomyces articulosus]|uniref:Uncharacterized protein n=1 Tax=Phascolomyces articulosus TaxID=60185 RepID=A0AAD5KCX6_9FUNG|nr:hypothetical protein BDA99DRAFT_531723 [Phascolomyces articulosus]